MIPKEIVEDCRIGCPDLGAGDHLEVGNIRGISPFPQALVDIDIPPPSFFIFFHFFLDKGKMLCIIGGTT